MPSTLKATLPYPPTVNHYWLLGNKRLYISPEGRQYRRRVAGILVGAPTFLGRLSVEIGVHPPDHRKRDIDNVPKAVLDALQHAGLFDDDNQIDRLVVARAGVAKPGAVEVRISELD